MHSTSIYITLCWLWVIYGTVYLRMDQIKYFKGCLPQILLAPFFNTLSHVIITYLSSRFSFGPQPRDHSFGTFPKFSKKLTFLSLPPLYQFSFPFLFLRFYLLISIFNRKELCILNFELYLYGGRNHIKTSPLICRAKHGLLSIW